MILYLCDIVGTFAFAYIGATYARQQQLNLLGIISFAALTSVGGGTIRELLLQHTPFYLHDYAYLLAILSGVIAAFVFIQRRITPMVPLLEALGTIIFAFNGAHAALQAGLGLPVVTLFAVLTAFGGGMLCNIAINQKPRLFYTGMTSALPSFVLAIICWIIGPQIANPLILGSILICTYSLQLITIYLHSYIRQWRKLFHILAKQANKYRLLYKQSL
jgi:uncharacterized membrane protein YeiH